MDGQIDVTSAEYVAICARMFGARRPRGRPDVVMAKLAQFAPARLSFEILRQRGKAFDSGEAGFHVEVLSG